MPSPADPGPFALLASAIVSPLLVLLAARSADWKRLVGDGRLNLWLGATVALLLLWRMRAGAQPGLEVHLVGATVVYLMFGLRLAAVSLAIAATGAGLAAGAAPEQLGLQWLLWAAVPLGASALLVRWIERSLPAHLFVFLWGIGFLASGLAVFASGLAQTAVLCGLGDASWARIGEEYLPFFILLGWSEAFTSGALLTLMVVWRPGWVAGFDEARYLRRR